MGGTLVEIPQALVEAGDEERRLLIRPLPPTSIDMRSLATMDTAGAEEVPYQ